jgi:uncharacterized protein (DUF433 family)
MALVIQTEPVPLQADKDGVIRVGNTRITLDTIVGAFNDGATAEEIVYQYPVLLLADVYAVLSYYLQQRLEVDQYILQRKQEAAHIRKENESRFSPQGIRERLLARKEA